jgi:diguanylate cyclase (GGDEF)-like protein
MTGSAADRKSVGGFAIIGPYLLGIRTMSYGRGKVLLNGNLMAAVHPLRSLALEADDNEHRELEQLRDANAHLLRELAALKVREARVQRLAERDGLTGSYNRRRMMELLDSAIADGARQGLCVGLLFVDLNGFKSINDECGHAAGDKILTTVAMRIATRVRSGDSVCRYGGDEFVVILPNVPDAAAVARIADTIRERIALPYYVEGCEQHLTAAVGESIYPRDGTTTQELLHRADQAMYLFKCRLARPMMRWGSAPRPQPSRRRNDSSKPRVDNDVSGGDL